MKRCPECRRDYYDDSLLYCLDDGASLLEGPKSRDEPVTARLSQAASEAPTKPQLGPEISNEGRRTDDTAGREYIRAKYWWYTAAAVFLAVAAVLGTALYIAGYRQAPVPANVDIAKTGPELYWQMTDAEQAAFVGERALHIQRLIGDRSAGLDSDAFESIRAEIGEYVKRKDSLSQKPFMEGLRVIFGRASQYAPLIVKAYEGHDVAPALGIYQAMIESEYRDCSPDRAGHGLFGFSTATAARYGMKPADMCSVEKQSDAAARYMSDLASDFGGQEPNPTLGLLSYSVGENNVRDMLRRLRSKGVSEQNFWIIRRHLGGEMDEFGRSYVPRFFAAAIIGETPEAFELVTPPLTSLADK